ncbi:bifunctional adenosylcobinamide kinase/adenosylcobinamide-phosphate guanylyltransferase [Deinococcus sp.]|uniref:bifunctional adenosylcobinamide kinase/adenosylcobinamide-phosphate guanylyltransferase n=1 Tax=Deinococcus sp. TaxID=47478 RepID=UPI0025BB5884|nr:bifunctional adenosylcobinamide kinase/adenosylcobinamide-phosphate guanylyltransferase [Deinococcus sp.]
MGRLIFVTGGARSGKSSYAEQLAAHSGKGQTAQAVTYLATAVPFDDEMKDRVGRHQSERPADWLTVEEAVNVAQAAQQVQTPVLLLDCLSVWVNNLMYHDFSDGQVLDAAAELVSVARNRAGTTICVTNEVGLGIVPGNALSRRYRDVLGWVNQRVAGASDEAYLLVSGIPLKLK